ncbi:MAG TPA: hypothetical protein VGF88_16590 [Acidobacteriaceae bacterium]|jgi:hypothetical protein
MAVVLMFGIDRDLNGEPALFSMMGADPANRTTFGLGARRREFHFVNDVLTALGPAQLDAGSLGQIERRLERGDGYTVEISDEQAFLLRMLPERDGFKWVLVGIQQVGLGDGSVRFTESYAAEDKEFGGAEMMETLAELEARVRNFVALDWGTIAEPIRTGKSWSKALQLPNETVEQIFEG